MWANAQHDGRPAEYRSPSVRRRKVWLTPTARVPCSNSAKKRNALKFAGVPQTRQQISAASMGRSSPYCKDMWMRYCCLTFFSNCRYVPELRRYSSTNCAMVRRWLFLSPVFSASRVQHVSDMHPKFALRPHHVWKYGRHPICVG